MSNMGNWRLIISQVEAGYSWYRAVFVWGGASEPCPIETESTRHGDGIIVRRKDGYDQFGSLKEANKAAVAWLKVSDKLPQAKYIVLVHFEKTRPTKFHPYEGGRGTSEPEPHGSFKTRLAARNWAIKNLKGYPYTIEEKT